MLARERQGHFFVAFTIPAFASPRLLIRARRARPHAAALVTRRVPGPRGDDHIYVGLAKMELTFVATAG